MTKRARSSITGKFVSKLFAKRNPDTTVQEAISEEHWQRIAREDLREDIREAIHGSVKVYLSPDNPAIDHATTAVMEVLVERGLID